MKILRRAIPVALGIGTLVPLVPTTANAADCSVSSYLTQGKRGSAQVRCVQQALWDADIDSGPVDGYFGPITKAAVVRYQQANALTVDGKVGPQTAGTMGVWTEQTVNTTSDTPKAKRIDKDILMKEPPAEEHGNSVWDRLAQCESGGNWSINTGSFDGGLQFLPSTWRSMGGGEFAPYAWQASREEQITVAERLLRAAGWGQWPACSRKLGLR